MTLSNITPGVDTSFSTKLNSNFSAGFRVVHAARIESLRQIQNAGLTLNAEEPTDSIRDICSDTSGFLDLIDTNASNTTAYQLGKYYSSIQNISAAAYANKSYSVAAYSTNIFGLTFNPDGTKMYVTNSTNSTSARIFQFALSTPYNPTSASYTTVFDCHNETSQPVGIAFNTDGTKMYLSHNGSTNRIYQYALSTGWLISSATYGGIYKDFSTSPTPFQLVFNPTGTRVFFVTGTSSKRLYQYDLSTAWNISTATLLVGTNYFDLSFTTGPYGLFIDATGTRVFVVDNLGSASSKIYQLDMPSAWNISGVNNPSITFTVGGQDTTPTSVFFKPDLSVFLIGGNTNDTIYQYTISQPGSATKVTTLDLAGSGNNINSIFTDIAKKDNGTEHLTMDVSVDGSTWTTDVPLDTISNITSTAGNHLYLRFNLPANIYSKLFGFSCQWGRV